MNPTEAAKFASDIMNHTHPKNPAPPMNAGHELPNAPGPKHLARCQREATRDVIYVFQRRRLQWTGLLPDCCEFDGDRLVWLKGADREKDDPITLDWLLEKHGSEYVHESWDVEGVWLDRDEATIWGKLHRYNYRDGWRVCGMPAEGELAFILQHWEPLSELHPAPTAPANVVAVSDLPFGLLALPLAIAGHVQQPHRLYIEVTPDVLVRLAAATARLAAVMAERDAWIATASQHIRNEEYYRGLVQQIGKLFGKSAYTSDDGSVQQDVLCAKVPELVTALQAREASLRGALQKIKDKTADPGDCKERPCGECSWCIASDAITAQPPEPSHDEASE